jgi:flagellar protein FlaG
MANNDLLVSANLQNIQPRVESKQQGELVKAPAEQLSNTVTESSKIEPKFEQEEQKQENQLDALQDKVTQLNQHMQNLNRSLQFSVDDVSGDTVVKVVDSETKEVVRQIPSQEVLDARNAVEQYRGMLLETKV